MMRAILDKLHHDPLNFSLWFGLLGSVAALGFALISQYGFGLHPCEMCYWQRVPYALMILLAGGALFASRKGKMIGVWVVKLLLALIVIEIGLAVYHAGVEWQWWSSVSGCGGASMENLTPAQILEQIKGAPSVSCGEPAFVLLGLSMAGWNAVYALGMAVVTGYALRLSGKKQPL